MIHISKRQISIGFLVFLLLSLFGVSSSAQQIDELLVTTEAKAQFIYGGAPRRIWESIRNVQSTTTPQQWQFRYEPLFLPEINADGKLAITKTAFGVKTRFSFNIVLDSEKARQMALNSVRKAYPDSASNISQEQVSAIVLSNLAIRIPDLDGTNIRIVKKEFPSISANNSLAVWMEAESEKDATEAISLLQSGTITVYYDVSFAARQATYNSLQIKFSDLKKSNLFAKLNGLNTTTTYVHRDDIRRLVEKSTSFITYKGQIENPEQVDNQLLKDIFDRFGTRVDSQAASFDAAKWAATFNGKDLEPSVLTKTLQKDFVWDEGSNSFKMNAGADTGGSFDLLGIFKADGRLKGNYSKEELTTFLRKHDIEVQFEGNMIVAKSVKVQQINLSDFESENVFSSVTAYVSKVQDLQKGHLELNASALPSQLDLAGRIAELERVALPVGTVVSFVGTEAEALDLQRSGWWICDGRGVSDTQAKIKSTPNLKDRFLMGSSTNSAGATGGKGEFSIPNQTIKSHTTGNFGRVNLPGSHDPRTKISSGLSWVSGGSSIDSDGTWVGFTAPVIPPFYSIIYLIKVK